MIEKKLYRTIYSLDEYDPFGWERLILECSKLYEDGHPDEASKVYNDGKFELNHSLCGARKISRPRCTEELVAILGSGLHHGRINRILNFSGLLEPWLMWDARKDFIQTAEVCYNLNKPQTRSLMFQLPLFHWDFLDQLTDWKSDILTPDQVSHIRDEVERLMRGRIKRCARIFHLVVQNWFDPIEIYLSLRGIDLHDWFTQTFMDEMKYVSAFRPIIHLDQEAAEKATGSLFRHLSIYPRLVFSGDMDETNIGVSRVMEIAVDQPYLSNDTGLLHYCEDNMSKIEHFIASQPGRIDLNFGHLFHSAGTNGRSECEEAEVEIDRIRKVFDTKGIEIHPVHDVVIHLNGRVLSQKEIDGIFDCADLFNQFRLEIDCMKPIPAEELADMFPLIPWRKVSRFVITQNQK